MLLVGSKALEMFVSINRIVHDWDIWMTDTEYNQFLVDNNQYLVKQTPYTTLFDIKGTIVEVKRESQFSPTDKYIFNNNQRSLFLTQFGCVHVPSMQVMYDMKKATALCIDEWKHTYDAELIRDTFPVEENTELFKNRLIETQARLLSSNKNKFEFFHKTQHENTTIATIPEYIVHDRLHEMICDLIGCMLPTYVRIINGYVDTDIEMFNKLSYQQKLSLMAEESLVLALERWYIPQMVEKGINHKLIEKFYNNNEAGPTYKLLKHVNITGLKGEEPEIVQFGRDNFHEIEKLWVHYKELIQSNGGFPKWFHQELFELRAKYRKGEKVGIHHDRY